MARRPRRETYLISNASHPALYKACQVWANENNKEAKPDQFTFTIGEDNTPEDVTVESLNALNEALLKLDDFVAFAYISANAYRPDPYPFIKDAISPELDRVFDGFQEAYWWEHFREAMEARPPDKEKKDESARVPEEDRGSDEGPGPERSEGDSRPS